MTPKCLTWLIIPGPREKQPHNQTFLGYYRVNRFSGFEFILFHPRGFCLGVVGGRVGEVVQRRVKAKGVKEDGQEAADLGFVWHEARMISHTLLTQKNTIGTKWNVYIK